MTFLKEAKKAVARDRNIEKAAGMELNLSTKSIPSKKKFNRKEKHKGQQENMKEKISESMKNNLKTLAGVNEEDYTITERGIKFNFKNSQVANYCFIIEYHDKYIVEFRKKTDNMLEGTMNVLISEEIIDLDNLQEHFESITGIYLSYMD